MEISFANIRQAEGIFDELHPIKERIERKMNLSEIVGGEKRVTLTNNKVMRICFLVGLSIPGKRDMGKVQNIQLSKTSVRIVPSFFSMNNLSSYYSPMLKLRYQDCNVDWEENALVSRIIAYEILNGRDYLMDENHLDSYFFMSQNKGYSTMGIPALELLVGDYGDDMEATLNINGRQITNAQIIIAGATGSGKTNLLAVLINEFRRRSVDSPYPVNFLLFDYKGEFSDPANTSWLNLFETDRSCILDPVEKPLPFTPFKDFLNRPIQEINLYSTEMANALCSLDRASISANMSNRLSEAIVNGYKRTQGRPISFDIMLTEYQRLMGNVEKDDSISSVLKQLVRSKLFEQEDKRDLVNDCFIVKMDAFPKDGPIAKAIVYFLISKLNNIYEQLEKQATNDEYVQIRHFTIIDEAHYMLDFDNRPLRNLIAVGRNKGLSIILATQNMESFKSKYFDFYANAQYPLIMKQQTINDQVVKDLFGVSGREFTEIKSEISQLQKGELIIKNHEAYLLDIGKKWKKIKVTHLI